MGRRESVEEGSARGVGGRWVVIFVPASSLISPLPSAGADGRGAKEPSRAEPRGWMVGWLDGRVAGWLDGWMVVCAVVLVRMHISVAHILIQGVITRLSSAHSHYRPPACLPA